MIRNFIESAPNEDDILITVRSSVHEYPLRLWAGVEDTVGTLKTYLGERLECFMDEMSILVSPSYPYPLADGMRLGALLVEHRHLLLLLHEGGQEPGRENGDVWWSQEVPERYLGQTQAGAMVMDFRYLAEESVKRVRSWLYKEREVEEIWLLGTHPLVMEILYAVAEDVLSLVRLRRVLIESPDRMGYQVPLKSEGRAEALRRAQGESFLQRQGLLYLYQHLMLDQYRSPDEVEIWVDGGLLVGMEKPTRFMP
jgi:hypothetical protein